MKAALDNVTCAIAKDMDALCDVSNKTANAIASVSKGSVSDAYLMNFGEEMVRGHALFVAAGLSNDAFNDARNACKNKSPWLVSSNGESPDAAGWRAGKVLVQNLEDVQGEDFTTKDDRLPIVFFSEKLGGLEDIPKGVSCVITKTPVDALSHAAIRARNTGAFLASVQNDDIWNALIARDFKYVAVAKSADGNSVEFTSVEESEAKTLLSTSSSSPAGEKASVSVPKPKATRKLVVFPDSYAAGVVGGKSQSLAASAKVAEKANVVVPSSFALPFGAFEKALKKDAETKASLETCLKIANTTTKTNDLELRRAALEKARRVVREGLELPDDFAKELEAAIERASNANKKVPSVDDLWASICGVWASKWTERAFNSRLAVGIKEAELSVAVLNMELCDAEFAFCFALERSNHFRRRRGYHVRRNLRRFRRIVGWKRPGMRVRFPRGQENQEGCRNNFATVEAGCVLFSSERVHRSIGFQRRRFGRIRRRWFIRLHSDRRNGCATG